MAAVGLALMSTASVALGLSAPIFGLSLIGHFLVTTAIGLAINALTSKPSAGGRSGYNVTQTGSALDHQIVYGEAKVAGVRVFDGTTGASNEYLHRVIALTGHEIESFEEIYINDALVTNLEADGNVKEVLLADGTSSNVYDGYIRIKKHLGSPDQLADSSLVSEVSEWTDNHRLQGISYLYVRFNYNQDVFPNGIPEVTATIKGKKVYDPRTGTTAWSNNSALCIRDYLTNTHGLNEDSVNIDDTLVESSANICDTLVSSKAKYTCNGNFTTGSTPYDILQYLLSSMGGLLWYAQGKWRMKPAYWTEPVLSLNDLRSSISISTRHSRRDNYNSVNGTFRGPETNWQVTDFPPVTNAAFLKADNNQESSIDLKLQFTDNTIEARRLARISLERNRQQLTIRASFGLRAFQVQVGDNISLTLDRFGWVDKTFEVTSWTFGLVDNNDLQVQMVLREISENVFDEVNDGIIYERDNTTLSSPFFVPTVGVNVSSVAQVSNQKVTNIAEVVVTSASPQFIDRVEVEYKPSLSSAWRSAGSGPLGQFEIVDLEVGDYDFRARAINVLGIRGALTTLTDIEVNPFTGPPSDVTGFFAEVSGNSLFLKWNAIPDPDLSHYIIKHSPAYSGATWNTSSTIVEKVARPSTSVAVPARAGTYLIKAYDKEGFLSENESTFVVLAESIPPLGNIETVTEDPTFAGTKLNVVLTAGTIEINNTNFAIPTGLYTFANTVDLGTVRNARVTGYVTFTRKYDNGTLLWDAVPQLFDTWPEVFDNWTEETAGFGDVEASVYVSTTNDDPASGSAVWSAYELASGSFFLGRGFRFELRLYSYNRYYTPNISELSATVEY
jgi:hypothetical protein